MKRSLHGEPLQERHRPPCVGLIYRRRWHARSVWCPRCHARPNRKCTSVPGDQRLVGKAKSRLADGLAPGRVHHERYERTRTLEALAALGAEALYRIAVRPPRSPPPQASTTTLPLFSRPT